MRFNRAPRVSWAHRFAIFVAVIGLLGSIARTSAETLTLREYEIKAAYLYNFMKYIDWPPQALPANSQTITIGVIGQNPFGPALATLNGKVVKDRKVVVKEAVAVKDLPSCQMVFISASETGRLQEILNLLKDTKVLTVSEVEGFAAKGGIINFIEERNKVRFEINTEAARRTGLTISSELLKLAKVVKS